jgi:hypothetical protein
MIKLVGVPLLYGGLICGMSGVASAQSVPGAARAALIPTLDQSLRPRRPVAEPFLIESWETSSQKEARKKATGFMIQA